MDCGYTAYHAQEPRDTDGEMIVFSHQSSVISHQFSVMSQKLKVKSRKLEGANYARIYRTEETHFL
jgi:hypothetical protein